MSLPDDLDDDDLDDLAGDDGEIVIECPYCDGDGETNTAYEGNGCITFDCPECGGTGWY